MGLLLISLSARLTFGGESLGLDFGVFYGTLTFELEFKKEMN